MREPRKSDVARVLNKAADLLEEVGWVRGTFRRRKDGKIAGYCAYGALDASTRSLNVRQAALRALEQTTPSITQGGLVTWNDARYRRKDQVVKAFRKAAEKVQA